MILDAISDLHGYYPKLPSGDLLIIAGDLTGRDNIEEYALFQIWLERQPYKHKVVIAGNHDVQIENGLDLDFPEKGIHYLEDSYITIEGIKIWGSPWSPWFHGVNPNCKAFMLSDSKLAKKYAKIPNDIDILISHCPPYGILDAIDLPDGTEYPVGCKSLLKELQIGRFTKLKHVIFGHIHEQGGNAETIDNITFINCSCMNENYKPTNKPIRFYEHNNYS